MSWSDVAETLEQMDADGVCVHFRRRRDGMWSIDVETPGGMYLHLDGELPEILAEALRASRGEAEIVWQAEVSDLARRLVSTCHALRRLRGESTDWTALDAGLEALLEATGQRDVTR